MLGRHLARCLAEVGIRDVYFNLTLLNEIEAEQPSGGGVRLVRCCNELNATYASILLLAPSSPYQDLAASRTPPLTRLGLGFLRPIRAQLGRASLAEA
ncbi:hypothetical protein ZWY2020_034584 [Hordeum vulgare]|nr:hypothetical protein ZWY2020_034584 [Hordeum vulgare]